MIPRYRTHSKSTPSHPTLDNPHARTHGNARSIYFPVHIFRSLAEPMQRLSVEYLPRFDPTPEQRADRKLYAKAVQRIFCESTGLRAADSGYAEKTMYHTYLRKQFQRHPWGALAILLPAPDRHREMLESRGRKSGSMVQQAGGDNEGGEAETRVNGRAEDALPVGGAEGAVIPNGSSKYVGGGSVLRRRVG